MMLTRKLRRKTLKKFHSSKISKRSGIYGRALSIYSLYKLIKYTGNAIEVRRSSDNAVQEFGYVNNYIDTTSILAFTGAGNGFISGYYDQVSGVKTTISNTAQQQQIVNGGTMITYTAKYTLDVPKNTSLSISGIAQTNRIKNLNAVSYVSFRGAKSITGYSQDYVYPIKCSAGVMDFGLTNGAGIFWYDADGNTSVAAKPSPNLVNAGITYMFATNIPASNLTLSANNTDDRLIGDTTDFPTLGYVLSIGNCSKLTGNVKYLPRVINTISMWGCSLLTGNVADLPRVLSSLDMGGCSLLTGNVADLPRVNYLLSMWSMPLLTGNVVDLPRVTYNLSAECPFLTGDVADLPRVTNSLGLSGVTLLTGNTADLPSVTDTLDIGGLTLLTGDVANIPSVGTRLVMWGCDHVTGDIADLPSVSNQVDVGGCVLLVGFYTPLNTTLTLYFSGTNMSPSDTDQTLINLAAITTVAAGGTITVKTNRTAASNAAVAALAGKFTINYV
jgi:hypothetical protein